MRRILFRVYVILSGVAGFMQQRTGVLLVAVPYWHDRRGVVSRHELVGTDELCSQAIKFSIGAVCCKHSLSSAAGVPSKDYLQAHHVVRQSL